MTRYKAFTNKEQADVMDRAADLLLFEGRARGSAVNDKGEYCLRGALRQAEAGDVTTMIDWVGWRSPAVESFRLWLTKNRDTLNPRPMILENGEAVDFGWSDQVKDDFVVIDALRSCAKSLREAS